MHQQISPPATRANPAAVGRRLFRLNDAVAFAAAEDGLKDRAQ